MYLCCACILARIGESANFVFACFLKLFTRVLFDTFMNFLKKIQKVSIHTFSADLCTDICEVSYIESILLKQNFAFILQKIWLCICESRYKILKVSQYELCTFESSLDSGQLFGQIPLVCLATFLGIAYHCFLLMTEREWLAKVTQWVTRIHGLPVSISVILTITPYWLSSLCMTSIYLLVHSLYICLKI